MKKIANFSILVVITILLVALSAINIGAEESPLQITVSTTEAFAGETVEVDIIVSANDVETGILGPFISLSYDPDLVLTGVKNGEFAEFTFTYGKDHSANPYKVLFDTLNESYSTGTLFTATFTVPEDAPFGTTYDISVSECDVSDNDFSPITPDIAPGKIVVNSYGGACGENANWRLYENGELVIYGEGVADTEYQPWADHKMSIKSVTVEAGITAISENAFAGCGNLASITANAGNEHFSSVDGVLFNKDATELIAFPAAKTDITYLVPKSVTEISAHAFDGCSNLTSITIRKSVTAIEEYAFDNTNTLKIICFENSAAHNYAVDNNMDFELITALESEADEADIYIMGAQLRLDIEDFKTDMRFITRIRKDFLDAHGITEHDGENVKFGSLILPYENGYMAENDKLSLDSKTTSGWNPAKVPAVNMFKQDETYVYYTVCLTDISQYERYYAVRPYLIVSDSEYVYGNQYQAANLYNVCILAAQEFVDLGDGVPAAITNIFHKCGHNETIGKFNDNEVSLPWKF